MKKYLSFIFFLIVSLNARSQEDLSNLFNSDSAVKIPSAVTATFKTTKLINAQTIEQVKHGELDFRVAHRFDDIGGQAGGIHTLYGFDNSSDIRISFDYGITDNWCVGFARSKGSYFHRQILDFSSKLKLVTQHKQGGFPLTISAFGAATITAMKSSEDAYSVTYFKDNFAHRIGYAGQLIIARKISSSISIELLPTYIHRNYVLYSDKSDLIALGIGGRIKFTKRMGIIFDYYQVFDAMRNSKNDYYSPLGIGLEIETGGHVFHLLFSNSKSLTEVQYLSESRSDWLKGQFRFGFNISRIFNITSK